MPGPTAPEIAQVYAEIAEATSPTTAEVLMHAVLDAPWDDLVTKDHLDARFAGVDERFVGVDERFDQIDNRFADVDNRFADVDNRFAEMDRRFDRLEADMDIRFTRLQADMDARFARVDARFAEFDASHARSMRTMTVQLVMAMVALNGALAAWFTAFH